MDPISSFLEVLGKIKREEFVVMQINIAPAGHEWVEEFEELVEKLQKEALLREKPATRALNSPLNLLDNSRWSRPWRKNWRAPRLRH